MGWIGEKPAPSSLVRALGRQGQGWTGLARAEPPPTEKVETEPSSPCRGMWLGGSVVPSEDSRGGNFPIPGPEGARLKTIQGSGGQVNRKWGQVNRKWGAAVFNSTDSSLILEIPWTSGVSYRKTYC